ncbi:MAG: E3 binding domain-containing protein, partial [Nitrospiraceae bacterium]|nr:E3 binding domain-containing protein [Nitrospiraceae bacterium]
MPYELKLPDLGEGITEAEIRKWLVKEGDTVSEHQNVLEVETDKAVVEMPSPRAGRVGRLLKEEGETAKVGEVLMTIAASGEPASAESKKQKKERPSAAEEEGAPEFFLVPGEMPMEAPAPEGAAGLQNQDQRVQKRSVTVIGELPESEEEAIAAAPAARTLAREMGISESALRGLKGSGPGGIITKDDVLKFFSREK